MERALPELCSQAGKGDGLVKMPLDIAAHRLHHSDLRVTPRSQRATAQAGTVSGMLGCDGSEEELDVLAPGPPRRAGRAAVHAGGRDGKDEAVVVAGIPG